MNPLNGLSYRDAIKLLNRFLKPEINSKTYQDPTFKPVDDIRKILLVHKFNCILDSVNVEYENDIPIRKVWKYSCQFLNDKHKLNAVSLRIIASGVGDKGIPMDLYQVKAIAS